MRLIERLYQFLEHKGLSAYAFERSCELSNGYLKKQSKGGGSVGSDVLDKIHQAYPDLSLIWLITGKGQMIFDSGHPKQEVNESDPGYNAGNKAFIELLQDKIKLLENTVADKDKIISLLTNKKEH